MPNRAAKKSNVNTTMARDHFMELQSTVPETLLDEWTEKHRDEYQRNIENMIGTVKVPVGVAGPLRVNGSHAQGAYQVPLATTEATLVASYHRGCKLISAAGGCRALLIDEGVRRAPGFAFQNLNQVSESGIFAGATRNLIIW